jgi:hypothetical protein
MKRYQCRRFVERRVIAFETVRVDAAGDRPIRNA